jgi:hypothetical protein
VNDAVAAMVYLPFLEQTADNTLHAAGSTAHQRTPLMHASALYATTLNGNSAYLAQIRNSYVMK